MTLTSEQDSKRDQQALNRIPWIRLLIAMALSAVAVFLVARNVDFSDVRTAYIASDKFLIVISVLIFLVTLLVKSWRWQLMFVPHDRRPKFGPIYTALILGQFFNLIFPIRMGDIARVYALDSQAEAGKARSLSTLVIEKLLEIVGLTISLVFLIPFVVIPGFILESGYPLAAVTVLSLIFLIILAYKTEEVIGVVSKVLSILPEQLQNRISRIIVAGLEGLDALRNWKLSLGLGLLSILIVILSVAVPLLLFNAFDIPLGAAEAVLLNVVVTIGMIPPSTPGKIVIFEGLVILMLRQFGIQDESLALSYAIIYHLVIIVPQIILGGVAFVRGGYRMPAVKNQNAPG